MISFIKLGEHGWFGNQIFQYAFLRSQALRLGVKFYCPSWRGDELFELNDGAERSAEAPKFHRLFDRHKIYRQPLVNCGFEEKAMRMKDGRDARGYFQSARYFYDPALVKQWFRFKEEKMAAVREKYRHLDLSKAVGIHMRFAEKKKVRRHRLRYFLPRPYYYKKALECVPGLGPVLVFSDEPQTARKWMAGIPAETVYMEGNKDYEDLYLMTQCRSLVGSVSTFSWWGAFLNKHDDAVVFVPQEGHFRPGHAWECRDYWCRNWITLPATDRFWDHYQTQFWLGWLRHFGFEKIA